MQITIDRPGEQRTGTILRDDDPALAGQNPRNPGEITIRFDDEPDDEYGFELGVDGLWYEINDSQTGWILRRKA